jgi:hypothetical protein
VIEGSYTRLDDAGPPAVPDFTEKRGGDKLFLRDSGDVAQPVSLLVVGVGLWRSRNPLSEKNLPVFAAAAANSAVPI